MLFRPYLYLVALLVVSFASGAKADAQLSDFFGSYTVLNDTLWGPVER